MDSNRENLLFFHGLKQKKLFKMSFKPYCENVNFALHNFVKKNSTMGRFSCCSARIHFLSNRVSLSLLLELPPLYSSTSSSIFSHYSHSPLIQPLSFFPLLLTSHNRQCSSLSPRPSDDAALAALSRTSFLGSHRENSCCFF